MKLIYFQIIILLFCSNIEQKRNLKNHLIGNWFYVDTFKKIYYELYFNDSTLVIINDHILGPSLIDKYTINNDSIFLQENSNPKDTIVFRFLDKESGDSLALLWNNKNYTLYRINYKITNYFEIDTSDWDTNYQKYTIELAERARKKNGAFWEKN